MKLSILTSLAVVFGAFASACSAGSGGGIGSSGQEVTGSSVSSIAAANIGGTACGKNSSGGYSFDSSCTGNGGYPEYWCADFARWVWGQAGAGSTNELSAAAGSFYVYGQNHGTLSSTPHVGDAVVFNYKGGGYADHVAIVSHVNTNGTIETISGDWAGISGSEAEFSSTSHVVLNAPAYPGVVGSTPGIMGMTISGFISPAGGSSGACPYGDGYCTSTMQCESGHWVYRYTDPMACTSGPGSTSSQSCSYGNGYCTATQQCDNGQWVARSTDPTACTSGPGASSSSDGCSEGNGYCTATLQCDGGHWIVRQDDPNACTTVVNLNEPCSNGPNYCTATLQCENGHWVPRSSDPAACTSGS